MVRTTKNMTLFIYNIDYASWQKQNWAIWSTLVYIYTTAQRLGKSDENLVTTLSDT